MPIGMERNLIPGEAMASTFDLVCKNIVCEPRSDINKAPAKISAVIKAIFDAVVLFELLPNIL
jgi:hypothetical protein